MMKSLIALLFGLWPDLASADYPMSMPCDSASSGQTHIVARPPTEAELAAEPAPALGQPSVLQMMNDYVACDGSAWNLTQTMKQYKGAPLPTFVPNTK
jgi:hypothetical protein